MLTQNRLLQLFEIDAQAGVLRWKPRAHPHWWNAKHAGKIAGHENADGYRVVFIDGSQYRIHRLIWLHVHGEFPPGELDHRYGRKAGDGIDNLRPATHAQNSFNRRPYDRDLPKGVTRYKGRFRALIKKDGKQIYLGSFTEQRFAAEAYRKAAAAMFGEFAYN